MKVDSHSLLITGGTGFFGRAFTRFALEQGASRVAILSRGEAAQAEMRAQYRNDDRLRFFIGDVRDQARLRRAMEGVDLVVHAAALKRVEVGEYDASEMVKTNCLGAINIIEAAHDAGVSKVVALSTDKACEPVNAYGASKLLAEKVFLAANNARGRNGPRFAVVRYGNVAGSTGSVIPTWRSAKERGRACVLTDPDATRFWMTADEACELVWGTAQLMTGGEIAIPDLPAYRLGDLARAMDVDAVPIGLHPGEKLHESMRSGETSEHARRMSVEELKDALHAIGA